jgi:hypothetical protein
MNALRSRIFAAIAALLLAATGHSYADPLSDATDARLAALLERVNNASPEVESYRAAVDFNIGLHTFPFLRRTVHGNTYFKRPDRVEVVFSDLPSYAEHFRNVYVGLGTPYEWTRKFSIELASPGTNAQHLVLTPKQRGGRLRNVAVYLDPQSSLPSRMVWSYHDGTIDMHQSIVPVDGHFVVGAQDADIKLPGVHAYVRARVYDYAFNVPIDDAVFTKKAS